jgi:hypothetical protein
VGAAQYGVPAGASVDGIEFIAGRKFVDWLARLDGQPVDKAEQRASCAASRSCVTRQTRRWLLKQSQAQPGVGRRPLHVVGEAGGADGVHAVRPAVRQLLKNTPVMLATAIADRVGWTGRSDGSATTSGGHDLSTGRSPTGSVDMVAGMRRSATFGSPHGRSRSTTTPQCCCR